MNRGLAVLGALALIVLALFARSKFADGSTSSDGSKKASAGKPVVACTPDLMSVCESLATDGRIRANPPELDLGDASDPDPKIDAWITWNPAPQIADASNAGDKVWGTPLALGTARAAVLIDGTSADGLPPKCLGTPTWNCLGAAGTDLSVGVGDPATAEGIARLAPFARTFATDDDYTTLDGNGLADLVTSPPTGQAPAPDMAERLTTAPGSVSMVVGPNDLLLTQTKTAQGQTRKLRILSPTPAQQLTVVLAPRAGSDAGLATIDCNDGAPDSLTKPLARLGLQPCEGTVDAALAGFLFQVQKEVG